MDVGLSFCGPRGIVIKPGRSRLGFATERGAQLLADSLGTDQIRIARQRHDADDVGTYLQFGYPWHGNSTQGSADRFRANAQPRGGFLSGIQPREMTTLAGLFFLAKIAGSNPLKLRNWHPLEFFLAHRRSRRQEQSKGSGLLHLALQGDQAE